jgi:hypothetical protein
MAGECFCGAVEIEVSGQPELMGYCHCRSCRSWSATPVNAFMLGNLQLCADHVRMYQKTKLSQRPPLSKQWEHWAIKKCHQNSPHHPVIL